MINENIPAVDDDGHYYSDIDDDDKDPDYTPNVSPSPKKKIFFSDEDLCTEIEDYVENNIENNPSIIIPNTSQSKEISNQKESDKAIKKICGLVLKDIVNKITATGTKKKTAKKERKNKEERVAVKYKLLPPCKTNCRRKCSLKFNEVLREQIRAKFWSLNFTGRRLFFDTYIKQMKVKYRYQEASNEKSCTLQYFFPLKKNETGSSENVQVCKVLFLHTLGLKTDGMITTFIKSKTTSEDGMAKLQDERGLISRQMLQVQKEVTEAQIVAHINSFNPIVSHYNLMHSPNRRYLPPELTIKYLWKDYVQQNQKISYDVYRKIFDKQNIGFCRPSQDECENCLKNKIHLTEEKGECSKDMCEICVSFKTHQERYRNARKEYCSDKERELTKSEKIYSVDMQKVLLLPKMSTKMSFFTSRYFFNIYYCVT